MRTAPGATHSPEEQLVQECYRSFEWAAQTNPRTTHSYRIADLCFTFSTAGDAVSPRLLPALEHHETTFNSPAHATIHIWDDAAQSGHVPRLSWNGEGMNRRGDIRGFGTSTIHATLDREPEILSVADTSRGAAFYFVRDSARLPLYETAAPLRPILFWLARSWERFLVHAGAVGDDTGAVLLAGKGGSGKSTTALACLGSDLVYLADDYCIVSGQGETRVWNLYNTAKATPNTLALLPFLDNLVGPQNSVVGDKTVLFLNDAAPHKLADTRPLKAILLPRLTGASEPHLTPASQEVATSALAISTMVQLPGAGSETLGALNALTAQLPCYYLDLGTNVAALPPLIQGLLATLA